MVQLPLVWCWQGPLPGRCLWIDMQLVHGMQAVAPSLHKFRNWLGTNSRVSHSNSRLGGGKQSKMYTSWFCLKMQITLNKHIYIYIYMYIQCPKKNIFKVFDLGFKVADLGKRALLLEMISGARTAWFALLCLVCLANLRVSQCVGGSRSSLSRSSLVCLPPWIKEK